MSAQSIAGRSRRPSPSEPDDVFLARALEFAGWAKTNVRVIIAVAVAVALLVGGLIYYRIYQSQRQERAAMEFLRLEQTAAAGNAQLASRDLEQFTRRYDGTVYAEEARIMLAQLHLQQDSAAKAVQVLSGATGRIDDSPVGPQAALLLAAAQQATGDTDAAVQTYLSVADEAELEFRRLEALENAAILRRQTGDLQGASELYQRLVEATEQDTPANQLYRMRLAEVEAQAQAQAQ